MGYRKEPSELLQYLPTDVTYLRLGANRWDKFKRTFPAAMHIKDYAKTELENELKKLTADEKEARDMDNNTRQRLNGLDASIVNDPEIVRAIRLAKIDSKAWSVTQGELLVP